ASCSTEGKPVKEEEVDGEPKVAFEKKIANFDPDTFSVMRCEFCNAGFDTRAGLSSHARAHLRDFGITNWEVTVSPIHILRELFSSRPDLVLPTAPPRSPASDEEEEGLETEEEEPGGGEGSEEATGSRPNFPCQCISSPLNVVLSIVEIGCEFCGEYFENRKGLSSHARSHLRQMGITEWTVNGSPIDTLRELITRRGLPCALPLKPLKSPPPSPGPPRSPLSSPASPSLLSRLPFAFAHPPSHQSTVRKMGSAPPASPSLIVKLKPEPMQLEVTMPGAVGGAAGYSSEPLNCSWSSSDNMLPLNLVEPTRDIRCEFCGEYFENRKGLSSHARSHLRQMGITEWTVNGSPIDTLRELMHKNGGTSSPAPGLKKETSQGSSPTWEGLVGGLGYQSTKFSRKSPLNLLPALTDNTTPLSSLTPSPDASCELCGFYFENRKALASHARAHLRQFGVTEWCVNGSPIETLSAWMRSRPHKVVEMHRSYMQGSNRSTSKKVREELIYLVVYLMVIDEKKPGVLSSCPGFERRPLKHPSHSEGGERDSGTPKPPRTGTIPALVPKPPSTPLVKVVGKIYSLRCRFCEVEFQGPLSVHNNPHILLTILFCHVFAMPFFHPLVPSASTLGTCC
uniref:WIZ zinc finger b n=1 Tax=Oncorhynchus kisutch TaxID=8019 RepID=A0A8C7DNT8_ONCKI